MRNLNVITISNDSFNCHLVIAYLFLSSKLFSSFCSVRPWPSPCFSDCGSRITDHGSRIADRVTDRVQAVVPRIEFNLGTVSANGRQP